MSLSEEEAEDSEEVRLEKALRPKEIVDQLDRYIVGQPEAKRAVAVAMRNRWRRQRVASPLKEEVRPPVFAPAAAHGAQRARRRFADFAQKRKIGTLQMPMVFGP